MRGVNLQHFEAGRDRATHRGAIGLEQLVLITLADRPRPEPALAERLGSRRHDVPGLVTAREIRVRQRGVAVPRPRHARFAPGMRELDGGQGALALYERRDAREAWDVRVVPDARV